jgi:signal transduction histidine kinase
VVLLVVALLVRPEQPRSLQEARWAALEWAMALVLGYFLVLHMAILPAAARQQPWYGVLLVQEVLPAAAAMLLATRGGAGSFQRVYVVMAAALAVGAAGALYPDWLYTQGRYELYSPWDAFWMLPLLGVAVAARLAPAAGWLRAPWTAVRSAPRPLAALVVAVPPLVDLLARALGGAPPRLAAQRTDVALAAAAVLALLVATRVRGSVPDRPLPAADADEARLALGEPNPYLQFTSGLAHELNNPLTAVSGWAELALHAGGEEPALRELLGAARSAADVVQQLQRATRAVGGDA